MRPQRPEDVPRERTPPCLYDRGLPGWRRFLPEPLRRRARPLLAAYVDWKRTRPIDLGALRRTTPIDPNWGFERGTPIDRIYIERFIGTHGADIRGRVLEVAAPDYTTRYGRDVERVDILMATEGNPQATIVGDLADAPQIPSETFDCAIVTQTLQFVYDVRAALATLHRILTPGGVLLATVPGITKISPPEDEQYGEWWHYTGRSARRLAEEAFGAGTVEVETYGNVLAAAGFLYGLAAPDLRAEELALRDPLYEVIIGVRAVKAR
jgi:SAM-dependent methyltransferase